MKYLFLLLTLLSFSCSAQAQNWLWATQFGTPKSDPLTDIEFTASGQLLLSGIFGDSIQIGSSQLIPPGNYGYGYVAKFQNDGTPIWGKSIFTNKGTSAQNFFFRFNVAETPEQEIVVSSHFANTMILGSDTLKEVNGGTFLTKLNSSGNQLWARNFGQPNVPGSNAMQLSPHVVDSDGNIYIACAFTDIATFKTDTLNALNGSIYIVKFDKNGEEKWVKQCGGTYGWARVYDLKIDTDASLYLTGTISDNAHFGTDTLSVPAYRNITYLAKMDKNGNFLWARKGGPTDPVLLPAQTGSSSYGVGIGLGADLVYYTGFFEDTSKFGNQIVYPLCGHEYCGNFFLVAYDKLGNFKWVRTSNQANRSSGSNLVSDVNGSVFIVGSFQNSIGFGNHVVTSNGINDYYIAKFDSSGHCNWLINFGFELNPPQLAVNCSSSGIYVGSSWTGSAGILASLGLPFTNNYQAFIAVLSSDFECPAVYSEEPTSRVSPLLIYPNPVENSLQFELDASYANTSIHIYSTLGSLVGTWLAVEGTNSIELVNLPQGPYFLVVVENNTGIKHAAVPFLKY
ncbi:MAG: T9SS type A sorting domain-containing protein [Saprospiraceae bacterium]